jgi:tripartite-type tricarboxylate transporter receptor subunit TctC
MQLLIVNAASDVKTVKDLIAKAKAQPGKLNYGAGTITTKLTGLPVQQGGGRRDRAGPYNGSAEVAQACSPRAWIFPSTGPPPRCR